MPLRRHFQQRMDRDVRICERRRNVRRIEFQPGPLPEWYRAANVVSWDDVPFRHGAPPLQFRDSGALATQFYAPFARRTNSREAAEAGKTLAPASVLPIVPVERKRA